MSLLIISVLNLYFQVTIPHVKIDDDDIKSCITVYLDSLSNLNEYQSDYHLSIRVEQNEEKKLVYIGIAPSLAWFKNNIPDQYSIYANRYVFWFEKINKVYGYVDFENQFREVLQRTQKQTLYEQLNSTPIGCYRFEIMGNRIVEIKEVPLFPGQNFVYEGLEYNEEGQLLYKDGVYHFFSIDQPHNIYNNDSTSHTKRLSKDSGIDYNYLLENSIEVDLVVDDKGKVIQVIFTNNEQNLPSEIQTKLRRSLLKMSGWNPATVNGKKVCYRLSIIL